MSQASLYSQNINFVFTSSSVPVAPSWSKGPCVKKTDSTATGQPFRASKNCWNPKHGLFPSQLPIGVEWGSTAWWPEMIRNSEQHPAKQLHYSTDGDVMSSQGDAKGAPWSWNLFSTIKATKTSTSSSETLGFAQGKTFPAGSLHSTLRS